MFKRIGPRLRAWGSFVGLRGHEPTVGGGPTKYIGDGEMMESDSSEDGSTWSRAHNRILGACGNLFRTKSQTNLSTGWQNPAFETSPTEYTLTWTAGDTSQPAPINQRQVQVHSMPISAAWTLEPVTKKCNYCGQETPDFRELRIGRLTAVVVCDMCMLKALSKSLEVPEDGGGDESGGGGPGDDKHQPEPESP